jgi:hypothetical protein
MLLTFAKMLVPKALLMVIVAGMSLGKTILKIQLASIGKLTLNPTVKLLNSLTVVT